MTRAAKVILICYLVVGVFSHFIANDRPILLVQENGQRSWPIFIKNWQPERGQNKVGYQKIFRTPVPFSADEITSLKNRYLPPLSKSEYEGKTVRHWLGTDRLGRDLAAIMIHGCRKSLYIAIFAMAIALLIGTVLGGAAGLLGNSAKVPWYTLLFFISVIAYALFLGFALQMYGTAFMLASVGIVGMLYSTQRQRDTPDGIRIWLDAFVMRMIEVFNSVPLLLLLVAASAILIRPTVTGLAVLIGVMSWTRFARFSRAEVMRIKEQEYVIAAKISGESDRNILSTYILPEGAPPLIVVFIFGISSAILLESTLSFLGVGLPIDEMTWGSVLSQVRGNIRAWWLALFPGLAIFLLITCLNHLADHVQDRLRSRPI